MSQITCHDIKGKKYRVNSSQLSFRPAIYGVIVEDNNILLSKQWDGYDFPGGGIDLGEKFEDALVREVKEETGMEVRVGELLHAGESFFKLPVSGEFVHSIHLYYRCHVTGGELSTEFFAKDEKTYADMPEWLDLDKAKEVKLYSSAKVEKVLGNWL